MPIDVPVATSALVRALMIMGPMICAAAMVLLLRLRFLTGEVGVTRMRLAFRGLQAGTGSGHSPYVVGLLVPVVGTASLMTAFAIEEEVRTGPNRASAHAAPAVGAMAARIVAKGAVSTPLVSISSAAMAISIWFEATISRMAVEPRT